MKKYVIIATMGFLLIGACSKNGTPIEQREKTERTIHEVANKIDNIESTDAYQALDEMPDGSPIEEYLPANNGIDRASFVETIVSRVPLFKRNVTKSPIDSIAGTWRYIDSTDEWVHISNEPVDGVVLVWDFKDTADVYHTARAEFTSLRWYNDSLLQKAKINLFVDSQKVAYLNYEISLNNDELVGVVLDGAIIGSVDFTVHVQAAEGHSLNERYFYGTVHISFSDNSGVSYALDITSNEDGSGEFRFTYRDNEDNWEVYLTISPANSEGKQTVSGYIKDNGTEVATIEGTIENGDFSKVYVVYADGTKVSIKDYLDDIDFDDD